MAFEKKLVELRTKAGLTVYALAAKSGVSRQALARLESGEFQPAWDTVQKLAAALGVDCTAFASAVDLPETGPPRKPGRPREDDEPAKPPPKKKGKRS